MSELGELLIGHVLGDRYRVEEVLGEGGFGVVCRASDVRRAGRDVAVKVLKVPGWVKGDARARLRDRFRHEAAFAARLPSHPNVVPIYDFGTYRERIDFLVMELLRGEDLRTRLERPDPLPIALALQILRDAARGVAVGHEGGLVHRDVKPGNLWLGTDAEGGLQVRVLDFGIAKQVDVESEETQTHVTMLGEGVFSRFYAAPEQLRRDAAVTRAADVFSLGVVAFEVLTRTRLFTQDDQARREQGMNVPTPSLRARNSDVPESVERVVRRCLAPGVGDRYPDARALAEALHRECCRLREPAMASSGARDDTVFQPGGPALDFGFGADRTEFIGTAAPGEAPDEGTVFAGGDATAFAPPKDGTKPADPPAAPAKDGARLDLPKLDLAKLRPPSMKAIRKRIKRLKRRARHATSAVLLRRPMLALGIVVVLAGSALGTAFAAATQAGIFDGLIDTFQPPDAEDARADNVKGLELFRRREYAAALERFQAALRIVPQHPEYWNNYGYTLSRMGRHQDAVEVLSAVVRTHPTREIAYSNLAEAQLFSGDTAAAVSTLEQLLAMASSERLRADAEALLARLRPPPPPEDLYDEWDTPAVPLDQYDPWANPEENGGGGEEGAVDSMQPLSMPSGDAWLNAAGDTIIQLPNGARIAGPRNTAAEFVPR